MTSGVFLSTTAVVIILAGVAVLAAAAAFVLETRELPGRRAVVAFFLSLLAVWLLACLSAALIRSTI